MIETLTKITAEAEQNVGRAAHVLTMDSKNQLNEKTRGKDHIAVTMGLQTKNRELIMDDYFRFQFLLSARLVIIFLENKVIVPNIMRE